MQEARFVQGVLETAQSRSVDGSDDLQDLNVTLRREFPSGLPEGHAGEDRDHAGAGETHQNWK